MKKGANSRLIFGLIEEAENIGYSPDSQECYEYVFKRYNSIYGQTSKATKESNLMEDGMIEFQERMVIRKLPQDGYKVDLIAAQLLDSGKINIVIAQQKGNNASFNTASSGYTLNKLNEVKNNKYKDYFNYLPDNLNPNINGIDFELDVIIGYTTAEDNNSFDYHKNIPYYCKDNYLKKMGIFSISMVEIDFWVYQKSKNDQKKYEATSKCVNFDQSFRDCINIYMSSI